MDDLPSSSTISRTGTRTPCGPSMKVFFELGYAALKSAIPLSFVRLRRFRGYGETKFQGFALNPVLRDTPGGLKADYIRAEGYGRRAKSCFLLLTPKRSMA